MRKLFLFIAAALVSTGMWAVDVDPSFIEGYTTTYDVSTSVTGFGNVYFASRSGITKNTPTDHTNYRTPKGNYVFELTQPSTIDITFYNTSSGRTVMIGLYTMDATVFSVWQNAANQNKNMLTWLIDNKTSYAADGETTLETYFSDKLKQSSGTIASGSDNEKALMPEATTSADGMSTYAQNLYTKYWRHESAASLNRNDPTIVSLNGGEPVPAGKYIMTIGDSGSNMGIETITITPASHTVKYYNNGGTGTIADATGTSITLSNGTGFTAPEGYSFAGWNTAVDGSGTAYAAGQSVSVDLNLYAQWTQTITLDANLANHGTGNNGSATALYNGTELSNIVHTTPATGYTLKGYYTAATEGVKVLNANGSFAANAITGYIVEGAWKKTGATTLYAQYAEPEKYSVTHTLTNVTATSGATGDKAATQGTEYVAVFAANAEYSLPASVTVTIGGDAQTEGEGYTYSAGTVTIPGAYVAGDIVITVEGVHNVCATPTITASTAFNFTNKGYAVTITNNEAGSTLKYSTDGTNWSDYTATLYATTTTTFYAKSVKSNYADSENASLEVTNSYDAEKKYIAWVYTSGYGGASYAFATDPMVLGLQADYNVIDVALAEGTNPTTATDIAEADLIVCSEAMQGGKTLSNNMKEYAGSTPMIGLKAFNYTKNRWSWGAPANPGSTTTSFKPKASNYKVLNGVTFESDGSIKLATASSGNVIQTVEFGTTDCTAPAGNVIMGNLDDSDAKAVMYASTKYFGLGLSSDCWETYTDNAVTIVKNAAAMLIAGEALDALAYDVNIALGIQNGTVTADKAKAAAGETVTLTVTPDAEYVATNVSYNGTTITPVNDVYSFTMPAQAVTVTATFAKSSTALDNTEVGAKAVKTLKNGLLIIEKNGVRYNMLGERVQ